MDGSHLDCCPSAADCDAVHDRKGSLMQNALACCTVAYYPKFIYVAEGHEGSRTGVEEMAERVDMSLELGDLGEEGASSMDKVLVLTIGPDSMFWASFGASLRSSTCVKMMFLMISSCLNM